MVNILSVFISQVGIQEDSAHTNKGNAIKYQDAAGLPKGGGFPWCMSLFYWCGLQAYGDQNPVPKTGGVLDCWNKVPDSLKIIRSNASVGNIIPGCQMILNLGCGEGHTGIVESIDNDGTLHTIEGNSNTNSSRDGYEVCRQSKRHLSDSSILGFINYIYPDSETPGSAGWHTPEIYNPVLPGINAFS